MEATKQSVFWGIRIIFRSMYGIECVSWMTHYYISGRKHFVEDLVKQGDNLHLMAP